MTSEKWFPYFVSSAEVLTSVLKKDKPENIETNHAEISAPLEKGEILNPLQFDFRSKYTHDALLYSVKTFRKATDSTKMLHAVLLDLYKNFFKFIITTTKSTR